MSYITLGDHNKTVIGCPITLGEYEKIKASNTVNEIRKIVRRGINSPIKSMGNYDVNGLGNKIVFKENEYWNKLSEIGKIELKKRAMMSLIGEELQTDCIFKFNDDYKSWVIEYNNIHAVLVSDDIKQYFQKTE